MRSITRTAFILLATSIIAIVVATAATGFLAEDEKASLYYEDYRVPTEQPPVAPDRPDLFEEQGAPEERP